MNYPSRIMVGELETLGIDVAGLRPERPPPDPSKFSPEVKRHLRAINIVGEAPTPPPAYPIVNDPLPDMVVNDLFFLEGGKTHEVAEGNDEEYIKFIQKTLAGEPPYPDQYSDDTLYWMDDDEFISLYLRAKRVVYCGRPFRWPIGANGVPYLMVFACGVWRVCPRCRQARIDKWLGRTLSAVVTKQKTTGIGILQVIYTTDSFTATAIRTLLGRKRYLCLPTEKGYTIITDDDNDEVRDLISETSIIVSNKPMAYNDLTGMDWDTLISTPENRRISGSLGKPEKKDDGKTPIISYSLVIKGIGCTPEHDEVVTAYTEAMGKVTDKYTPTTKSELEDALLQIALRWKSALERIARKNNKRFHVFVGEITIRTDLTRIALEEPIRAKSQLEANILAKWADDIFTKGEDPL